MPKKGLSVLVIAIFIWLAPSNALACSCGEPFNEEAGFERYHNVAILKVCEAHLDPQKGDWDIEKETVSATGRVIDTIKGETKTDILISAGNPFSSCYTPIAVGSLYLAFIEEDGHAVIMDCYPSVLVKNIRSKRIAELVDRRLSSSELLDRYHHEKWCSK